MRDNRGNKNKNSGDTSGSYTGRNTEDFKLELTEEDIMTGTVNVPRRQGDTGRYHTGPTATKKMYYTEKERRQEKKEHKKRNRIKAGKNKRVFSLVWLAMVLLVSFTLASYLIAGANDFLAKDRNTGIVEVQIPENVTTEQLAKILYESGAINREDFFTLYCKVTAEGKDGDPGKLAYIQPKSYSIDADLDYEDIINTLMSGDDNRETVRITFPEGVNALDIAKLLEENGVCSKDDALAAMDSDDFEAYQAVSEIKDSEARYYKLEGYLYPDTFDFYKGEDLKSVLGKLLNNFQTQTKILEDEIKNSSMTRDEILTLASIIQREAANVNDMYMVSAVLHNRLEKGADVGIYYLECDSTIYYPYRVQEDLPEEQKSYISNYNTYQFGNDAPVVQGLPAGPICNPGIDAIKAALQPSAEGADYFYFCHSSDGTAYYASNADEHYQNQIDAGLID